VRNEIPAQRAFRYARGKRTPELTTRNPNNVPGNDV
jgi:hypothetical protein